MEIPNIGKMSARTREQIGTEVVTEGGVEYLPLARVVDMGGGKVELSRMELSIAIS